MIHLVFTSVNKSVPEDWVKVRFTKGPSIVQSTLTLPSPGVVLNTNRDSVSPVIYTKQLSFFWNINHVYVMLTCRTVG